LPHVGQRDTRHRGAAFQHHVNHFALFFRRKLFQWRDVLEACVVDQNSDIVSLGRGCETCDRLFIPDV
jgi:hypothetical protein